MEKNNVKFVEETKAGLEDIINKQKELKYLTDQDIQEGAIILENFLLYSENAPEGYKGSYGLLKRYWFPIKQGNGTYTMVNLKNGLDIIEGFETIQAIEEFLNKRYKKGHNFISRRDFNMFIHNRTTPFEMDEAWN